MKLNIEFNYVLLAKAKIVRSKKEWAKKSTKEKLDYLKDYPNSIYAFREDVESLKDQAREEGIDVDSYDDVKDKGGTNESDDNENSSQDSSDEVEDESSVPEDLDSDEDLPVSGEDDSDDEESSNEDSEEDEENGDEEEIEESPAEENPEESTEETPPEESTEETPTEELDNPPDIVGPRPLNNPPGPPTPSELQSIVDDFPDAAGENIDTTVNNIVDKLDAEQLDAFNAAFGKSWLKLTDRQKNAINRAVQDSVNDLVNATFTIGLAVALGPVGAAIVNDAAMSMYKDTYNRFIRDDYASAEKRRERDEKQKKDRIKKMLKRHLEEVAESREVQELIQEELRKKQEAEAEEGNPEETEETPTEENPIEETEENPTEETPTEETPTEETPTEETPSEETPT